MNISELARRLNVPIQELRNTLPELGFHIGQRAIKVDDQVVEKITKAWAEHERLKKLKVAPKAESVEEPKAAESPTVIPQKKALLPPFLSVRDFAVKINTPVTRVMTKLLENGVLASVNQNIDFETAAIVAADFGFSAEPAGNEEAFESPVTRPLTGGDFARPPVVVVMGHVDHGKTSLLDFIRKTKVAAKEAGGITQHIGAYQVEEKDKKITFLDTPGHEAFTAMRSRGAKAADIAILVVAADDGVQPQTREALKIIQAAQLPFVVAVNKIDKPNIDLNRLKTELSEAGIVPEEWGGKTILANVSAKTGQGIGELLDTVLLLADLDKEKLLASQEAPGASVVIEAHVNKNEGVTATLLVQNGTLRQNDTLSRGNLFYGKVRLMKDWNGQMIKEAGPGTPVKILGFKIAPEVGDVINVPGAEQELDRSGRLIKKQTQTPRITATAAKEDKKLWLNLILRADVLGSLEAIINQIEKFNFPDVGVKITSQGLGHIGESDCLRAEATGAKIFGFNVHISPDVVELVREKKVDVRTYEIIYDLLDTLKAELEKMLPQEVVRTDVAKVKILQVFRSEKKQQIVGGTVLDGRVEAGLKWDMVKHDQIYAGTITELQSGKQTVKEVRAGQEFGMKLKLQHEQIEAGDVITLFKEEKRTKTLE